MVKHVLAVNEITCSVLFTVVDDGTVYVFDRNSVVGLAVSPLNEQVPFESRKANVLAVAAVAAPETAVPLILLTTDVALLDVTSPPIVMLVAGVANTAFVPL
jgi:hypothetical protein